MKKLDYLDISSWQVLGCPLRIRNILHYRNNNSWHFMVCPLRLSGRGGGGLRNCTTPTSVVGTCRVVLWVSGKNLKKVRYLEISCWDLLGFPSRSSEKYEETALPWRSFLRRVGLSFEAVRGKRRNCTILALILQTCWAVLWGCHKRSKKKLHDLDINSWHLFLSFDVVGGHYFDISCWDLSGRTLRLSEKNLKKLHYLAVNWDMGCPFRLSGKMKKLHYVDIICWDLFGCTWLPEENMKKLHYLAVNGWDLVCPLSCQEKVKALTTIMSTVYTSWVVPGCQGNNTKKLYYLTSVLETCWTAHWGR